MPAPTKSQSTSRSNIPRDLKPHFFATPSLLRAWFETYHSWKQELWVGFHKKGSGKPSVTWPEAVDEALCFGWIDGVRKSLDEDSYVIRFTPRKPGSAWSAINTKRANELKQLGRMHPAGEAAVQKRDLAKTAIYAYEQRSAAKLDEAQLRLFQANARAWEYFQAQPPWYRRTATYWVVSAKREETRASRLETLIRDSASGRPIAQLTRPGRKSTQTVGRRSDRG